MANPPANPHARRSDLIAAGQIIERRHIGRMLKGSLRGVSSEGDPADNRPALDVGYFTLPSVTATLAQVWGSPFSGDCFVIFLMV